jgi:hypothetical protein
MIKKKGRLPSSGLADESDRIGEQIRANRQTYRAALTRELQALRHRFSEHELDKLAEMAVNNPGLLQYLQHREELVPITLALMLSRREQRGRWSASQQEIVSLVDRVTVEGTSRYQAYKRVARMLGKTEAAVTKAYKRGKAQLGDKQ